MSALTESNSKIEAYISQVSATKAYPKRLSEIDLPFKTLGELKQQLSRGDFKIHCIATETNYELFDVLASRREKLARRFCGLAIPLIGVATVYMAVRFSAWYLLLLLTLPKIMHWYGLIYFKAVERVSLQSEEIFCFLYSAKQVAPCLRDGTEL